MLFQYKIEWLQILLTVFLNSLNTRAGFKKISSVKKSKKSPRVPPLAGIGLFFGILTELSTPMLYVVRGIAVVEQTFSGMC